MGVNSQSSVPTFTSGQVLTAQQQNWINTGVPVFDSTTQRDGAFGGTGEKTLAEGQLCYLEDTNTVQYYDGANWLSVDQSGATLITTVTISAASTTNVNNCFTSSYRNYLVTSNLTTSANTGVAIRLRAGGTDNTTSNYSIAYYYQGLTSINNGNAASQNTSQFNLHIANVCRALNMNMLISNPQAADYTTLSYNNLNADGAVDTFFSFMGGGQFRATTQFDGFSIYTGGAPTISGTIRIYGLRN